MSKQNPRIALTVPQDLDDILERLSLLQGVPKTKIILGLLLEQQSILERIADALEKIEQDRGDARNIAKDFAQSLLVDAGVAIGDVSREIKDL